MDLICRTCLNKSDNMKPIFLVDENGKCISKIFESCFGLNIQQLAGFPTSICSGCLKKVNSSYQFRQQCEISYNVLLDSMDANMKCRLCSKQYTLLTHLQEHYTCDHPDEIYEIRLVDTNLLNTNENVNKLPKVEKSIMSEIKMEYFEEKFTISEPESLDDENNLFNVGTKYETERESGPLEDPIRDATDLRTNLLNDTDKQDEPFSCTLCTLTFEQEIDYHQHIESKHNNIKVHQCDLCDKKFSRPKLLQIHQATHLDVKYYPCEKCDKRFYCLENKTRHMQQHTNNKPYKCTECDTGFTRADNLRRHRENRHTKRNNKPAPPKTEICDICQKAFTTPKNLLFHMKAHRTVIDWTCKFCQLKFNTKQEHNDHQKIHIKERPFLCSECGLRFSRNDYLIVHMRRHKGEKPFKCKFCNKGFPRSSDVTMHEHYHTGEKKHLCTTCGKGFQRAYNLLVHTRVHTGERPYKCLHCDKSFTQGNDLKAHVRRHTGELFKCDICTEGFVHLYHLTQHQRKQHGIDNKSRIGRVEKFIKPTTTATNLVNEK